MKYERISDALENETQSMVVNNIQFTDLKEYNLVLNQGMLSVVAMNLCVCVCVQHDQI